MISIKRTICDVCLDFVLTFERNDNTFRGEFFRCIHQHSMLLTADRDAVSRLSHVRRFALWLNFVWIIHLNNSFWSFIVHKLLTVNISGCLPETDPVRVSRKSFLMVIAFVFRIEKCEQVRIKSALSAGDVSFVFMSCSHPGGFLTSRSCWEWKSGQSRSAEKSMATNNYFGFPHGATQYGWVNLLLTYS